MDAVYVFRHSAYNDLEIRYSLRSLAKHFPAVRKVWIFGDRPAFLCDDTSIVEHVPHCAVARIGSFPTPVTNFFQLMFLSSLIPELDAEYLRFSDDYVLLDDVDLEMARKVRYLGDLSNAKSRGQGLWKDSLWRTYDLLKRLGYPGYNFETHTPTYQRRKWVMDAYCEFKDFVTNDRWFGMLGPTALLNHVVRHNKIELTHLESEGARAGFWHKQPTYEDVVEGCRGRVFLNFDDEAFGPAIQRFLRERYPTPSIYETSDAPPADEVRASSPSNSNWYPPVSLEGREQLGSYLNSQGLVGEGVEVGTGYGRFAEQILNSWRGRVLHCVDPWADMTGDDRHVAWGQLTQEKQNRIYKQAMNRLKHFGDRCQIHRLTSKDAAKKFADRSLDFVYLDARHYREAVEEDMNLWAAKIRPGGLLAGHDYLDGVLPSGRFEVKSVVDRWAEHHGCSLSCTGEKVWRSWLIRL